MLQQHCGLLENSKACCKTALWHSQVSDPISASSKSADLLCKKFKGFSVNGILEEHSTPQVI
jgi:hypothetical protein